MIDYVCKEYSQLSVGSLRRLKADRERSGLVPPAPKAMTLREVRRAFVSTWPMHDEERRYSEWTVEAQYEGKSQGKLADEPHDADSVPELILDASDNGSDVQEYLDVPQEENVPQHRNNHRHDRASQRRGLPRILTAKAAVFIFSRGTAYGRGTPKPAGTRRTWNARTKPLRMTSCGPKCYGFHQNLMLLSA